MRYQKINQLLEINFLLNQKINHMAKQEPDSPLIGIATQKHYDRRLTGLYPYLQLTPENERTYQLGFCDGASHIADLLQKQIEIMDQYIKQLERQKSEFLNQKNIKS